MKLLDGSYGALIDDYLAGRVKPRIIKESKSRVVHRVERDGRAVYIKKFLDSGLRALIRDRAAHEAKVLGRLVDAGVGAAKPVAVGKGILVTAEIANARELGQVLKPSHIRDLARFVRAVHDAGVRDDDLHVGNILVSDQGFHLIDVHQATLKKLSGAERADGVAFLLHSLWTRITPARALALVYAYAGNRDPAFAHQVWKKFQEARQTYWIDRTKRCLKDGREFAVDGPWRLRRPMTRAEAESIASQPGRLVKELKNRRIRVVGRSAEAPRGSPATRSPAELFVKEHPRGLAEWENAHALEVRHLPTPKLWAAKRGVVIGEWHARAVPLWDYVKASWPTWSRSRRDAFLYKLARDVRRLHVRGCFHKDLKANNIIVEDGQILFIDLDRVKFALEIAERDRLFNLAQLNAAVGAPLTVGERLRFYRYYAGNNREWRMNWKRRVREIMKTTVARKHHWPSSR